MADPLRDLYGFKEKKFFSLTHAVRVYVFGVEVTDYLKGSVAVTYSSRDSFNTCNFELSNPRQIFQITYDNSPVDGGAGSFRNGSEYSEQIKKKILAYKNDPTINPLINLNIRTTMNGKPAETNIRPNLSSPRAPNLPNDTQERKYRLAIGDCIFNKHDPIRVFIRNPYANRDEWMEVFCGYVNSHPISTNWLNGESSVRIDCYCVRHMMTKMRATHNIRTANSTGPILTEGFYQDFAMTGKTQNHAFADTNLETAIRQLIIGENYLKRGKSQIAMADGAGKPPNSKGIGWFTVGNTVCYDPTKDEHLLERWHLMTLFGCHKSGFPKPSDDLWLTGANVKMIGEETLPIDLTIGGPDSRYLHFLLPTTGTGASSLSTHSFDSKVTPPEPTWTTRWDIIREFAAALDFQVMTSPSGDILVEFPQYGFMPSAYGSVSIPALPYKAPYTETAAQSAAREAASPSAPGAAQTMDKAGGLSPIFVFDLHQKEETLNDEADDFPTILTITGSMANANLDTKSGSEVGGVIPTGYVYSPVLCSRYGVIAETVDLPYLGQKKESAMTEALTTRLGKIGSLEFTKRMANAASLDTSVVYRPLLFPNRPVWLKRSHRAGCLTSVAHTWNLRQDATTTISMNMLMAERRDRSYRPMHGSANMPIDYLTLWGVGNPQEPNHPDSGLRTSATDKPATTASETQSSPKPSTDANGNAVQSSPAKSGGGDFEGLYPALKTKINRVIEAWNKENPKDPVVISSGYRSEENQRSLYELYKSGKGNPANPPGSSWHEWGLAVDMYPTSCGTGISKKLSPQGLARAIEFAAFVKKTTSQDTDGPLVWKGAHDHVHYQPSENYWNITTNSMQKTKAANAEYGSVSYKAVWQQLDVTLMQYGIKPEENTQIAAAGASQDTGFRPTGSGTEENRCNAEYSAVPTLTKLKG